ncbi:hypothetical protein ACTWPT_25970 [Nonomuraea sp. 3N208]|uniref:hypothetical protein n=1 Tax=Nonomuraea sp. 3N208 TaxID=3457421 RepID=UPI003FD281AA
MPFTSAQKALRRGLRATYLLVAAFLAGEVSALLAIAFEWFNAWTLSITGACLLMTTIAAAVIPLTRLLSWTKL